MTQKMKADVYVYDVLGNARDGYEVNDVWLYYYDLDITEEIINDRKLLRKWIRDALYKKHTKLSSINLDVNDCYIDTGTIIYWEYGASCKPQGEIRIRYEKEPLDTPSCM